MSRRSETQERGGPATTAGAIATDTWDQSVELAEWAIAIPTDDASIIRPDQSVELAEWAIAIPTDDASIIRRRRALAPIQVLTDVERTKTSLDGDFWARYDLVTIALAVIDQVALAMGISAGRSWDETVEYTVGQAARQVPDADAGQWAAVAERVVVSLVTTDVETVPYLMHTTAGPSWRAQRFRLLYVHAGSDGVEHLRASEQAINIFIEAARTAHDSPAYQKALAVLDGGAVRDLRIVPGV